MKIKAIIFDVDGVIIKSEEKKGRVIRDTLEKYGLLEIAESEKILELRLNRKIILEMLYKIKPFDTQVVLDDINAGMIEIENNPEGNANIINFIEKNTNDLLFFTNTSLPIGGCKNVMKALGLTDSFEEILAYETGTKIENTNYVLEKYTLKPEEVLFIDDTKIHIERVGKTGVHTLHFTDFEFDLEEYLGAIL